MESAPLLVVPLPFWLFLLLKKCNILKMDWTMKQVFRNVFSPKYCEELWEFRRFDTVHCVSASLFTIFSFIFIFSRINSTKGLGFDFLLPLKWWETWLDFIGCIYRQLCLVCLQSRGQPQQQGMLKNLSAVLMADLVDDVASCLQFFKNLIFCIVKNKEMENCFLSFVLFVTYLSPIFYHSL